MDCGIVSLKANISWCHMNIEELLSHSSFVHSLARSLVMDSNHADDISQKTLLAALEKPPSTGKPLKRWLSVVVRNFAKLTQRSESRRSKYESKRDVPVQYATPEEITMREEIRQNLVKSLLSLSEPYRTTIILRYYEDLTAGEIAEHMEVPLETVKTRIQRGLAQLRKKLDTQYGGDRKDWLMAIAPIAAVKFSETAGAASGVGSAITGVIAMSTKVKSITCAVLILVTVLLTWRLLPDFNLNSNSLADKNGHDPNVSQRSDNIDESISPNEILNRSATSNKELLKPTAQISGRILDKESKDPVGDSSIILTTTKGRDIYQTESDRDGRFLIPQIASLASSTLQVNKHGYFAEYVEIDIKKDSAIDMENILLAPLWRVTGNVVNEGGEPIIGAQIKGGSIRSNYWYKFVLIDNFITTTDKEGSFSLHSADYIVDSITTSSPTLFVDVEAEGYATIRTLVEKNKPNIIKVEPGRDIKGKLIWTLDGGPIAGARILWYRINDKPQSWQMTITDSDGYYSLSNLPTDDLRISFCILDNKGGNMRPEMEVVANESITDIGIIRIDGPTAIDLWAYDNDSSLPVQGLTALYGARSTAGVRTDSNGNIRIQNLPANTSVTIECYNNDYYWIDAQKPVKVKTLESGSILPVKMSVRKANNPYQIYKNNPPYKNNNPPIPVSVVVMDMLEQPIAGVRIDTFTIGEVSGKKKTDEFGRFKGTIPGGKLYCICLTHRYFKPLILKNEEINDLDFDNLCFHMEALCELLHGMVVNSSGEAISNSRVRCKYRVNYNASNRTYEYELISGEDGRFSFPFLSNSKLSCFASLNGYKTSHLSGKSDTYYGKGNEAIRLILELDVRMPLKVRCVSSDGRPLARYCVSHYSNTASSRDSKDKKYTDSEGRVEFDAVPCYENTLQKIDLLNRRKGPKTKRAKGTIYSCQYLHAGNEENLVICPSGQALEILLRFNGENAKTARDQVVGLKEDSQLDLCVIQEDTGNRISLLLEITENDWIYYRIVEKYKTEKADSAALLVNRFLPPGRYHLSASMSGYTEYLSGCFDVVDSDDSIMMNVDLNPIQ